MDVTARKAACMALALHMAKPGTSLFELQMKVENFVYQLGEWDQSVNSLMFQLENYLKVNGVELIDFPA